MSALTTKLSPLQLCHAINQHVAQHIQFCPTNPARGWHSHAEILQNIWITGGIINIMREETTRQEVRFTTRFPFVVTRTCTDASKLIELAKRFLSGNCEEMALLGEQFGNSLRTNWPIERFFIRGGDHTFLVIARPKNASVSNYTEWGNRTVVADPWAKQCYRAHKIPQKLDDYLGPDAVTLKPNLEKFANSPYKSLGIKENTCTCDQWFAVCV